MKLLRYLAALLACCGALLGAAPALAANPLVVSGGTYSAGKFGTGIASSTSAVETSVAGTAYPITAEAWASTTATTGLGVIIGQDGNTARNLVGWYVGVNAGKAQAAFANTSGTSVNITTTVTVNDGALHHFALVLTGTSATLFVDGVQAGTASGTFNYFGGSLNVGHYQNNAAFNFAGVIDEIAVWQGSRYTTTFTPPTSAYSGSEANLLTLHHLDGDGSDSAGAVAATAYTLSGPASGSVGVASSNFTVAANGTISATVVVTPSDSGNGGTFSPSTVSLTSGAPSATFTYTPATTGSKTISTTNSGSLTNPAAVTYTVGAAPTTIAVASTAFHFSPSNWDTGTGYRSTIYPGAYFSFALTASASPTATILLNSGSSGSSPITMYVNGIEQANIATSGVASIAVSNLKPNVTNTIEVWVTTNGTWGNAASAVRVTGIQIDSSSAAGTAPTFPKGWVIIVGDSITQGYKVDWSTTTNFIHSYGFMLCRGLMSVGYDCSINAITGSGWIQPANGGSFPAYYLVSGGAYADGTSRWNKLNSGVSNLDSSGHLSSDGVTGHEPAGIFINYGTNEGLNSKSLTDTQAAVDQNLTALRTAAPNAKIGIIRAFPLLSGTVVSATVSANYLAVINAGLATHASDANVRAIDIGTSLANQIYTNQNGSFSSTNPSSAADTVHLTLLGHSMVAPTIMSQILPFLSPATGAASCAGSRSCAVVAGSILVGG